MLIPDQFNFIKWLKDDTVALVNDDSGRKIVVKENERSSAIRKFSETVKEYTRILRLIIPEIYAEGAYIYHAYVEGETSGDTTDSFGISSIAMLKINPKTLAQALYELYNLSRADFISTSNFEVRKSDWYIKNLEEVKEAVTREYDQFFFESIGQYLRKCGRTIDASSKTLVNGDLHPQNIFINCLLGSEAKDFVISDWDLLQLNNPGYDLADLYVWSWRNRGWFNAVLSEASVLWKQNDLDIVVFVNFCSVYLSSQLIKHVYKMRETNLTEEAKSNADKLLASCKETLKRLIV